MNQTRKNIHLCASPSGTVEYLSLRDVELSDGKAPEWIQLVPAGKEITALDGRKFGNSDPKIAIDAFNKDPRDIAIDWEHASEKKAPKGEEAPAAGWIVAMEERKGSIWGKVEWTPRGIASLESREYRYLSPAFAFNAAKKIVIEIVSAALTNRPALDLPALARAEDDNKTTKVQASQEKTMNKELLELLGLFEDATPEQIKAALIECNKKIEDGQKALDGKDKEIETARAANDEEIKKARAANPDLTNFVPRSDYEAVVQARNESEAKIESDAKAMHQKNVDAEITGALKSGKITPASKDFYVETCSSEDGLKKFQGFLKDAPVIGADSGLDKKKIPVTKGGKMTDIQIEVARNCGISNEQFLASANDEN